MNGVLRSAVRAAAAALFFALCTAFAVADEVTDAVEKGHAAYVAALQNASAAELAALFTDDGTLLPSSAPPVRGRAAIKASYERSFHRLRVSSGTMHTSELIRRGDILYDMGEYSFDYDVQGRYAHATGRYLTIWRKVSGVWKMDVYLGQQDAPL